MLLGKPIFLKGWEMVVDLIVFDMLDFNIILGMNFLSCYKVEIDYRKKKVWLHLNNGEKFMFGKGRVLSLIINSRKAKKMLSKGYIRYIAYVINKVDK